jgi:hypothetical protein
MEEATMSFDDLTRHHVPHYPTPSSRPSEGSDGTGIVLLLAVAIVVVLILMSYPGGDGRFGVTNTASPTFKTPAPAPQSTSPAEPTPKPTTEPTPKPATEPLPDPTTEPTPNPTTEPADAGADPVSNRRPERCPSPKPGEEADAIDLEQDLGTRPAEPVETDSNDEPAADANGDSDDERPDENQAVPDPTKRISRSA